MSVREAIVKLGGSVVTDKASDTLRVDSALVRRLAGELRDSALTRCVIVHGAGSFGHRIVARTGLDRGLAGPSSLLDWAETQRLQYLLAAEIAGILIEEGLPAIACQASASAIMSAGRLVSMDCEIVRFLLQKGGVPMLYGVPAADLERGCAILSGDQIAPYLAVALGIGLVVHCTDVDGVFADDPHRPGARPISGINHVTWPEVGASLGGSRAVDVTGGMQAKVAHLMEHARAGVEARIINAHIPGRLQSALAGESVGTLVSWEVKT